MLKIRLIPVVLLRNGAVVQSKGFQRYQKLGDPTTIVRRLSGWAADELIYLDISRDAVYDIGRDDLNTPNRNNILEILRDVSRECFMPLTFGGRVRTLEDARERVRSGADKVAINTQALADRKFIRLLSRELGSQCVVVCIDVRRDENGKALVFADGGRTPTGRDAIEWARDAEAQGAGEILLQSIDRDGRGSGYDIDLIRAVTEAVGIPVIALGGAGDYDDFKAVAAQTGCSAVAAANIFHYRENSVYLAKKCMYEAKLEVRHPMIYKERDL